MLGVKVGIRIWIMSRVPNQGRESSVEVGSRILGHSGELGLRLVYRVRFCVGMSRDLRSRLDSLSNYLRRLYLNALKMIFCSY